MQPKSPSNKPPKITDTYFGDFNTFKNDLNQVIDAVNHQAAVDRLISQPRSALPKARK